MKVSLGEVVQLIALKLTLLASALPLEVVEAIPLTPDRRATNFLDSSVQGEIINKNELLSVISENKQETKGDSTKEHVVQKNGDTIQEAKSRPKRFSLSMPIIRVQFDHGVLLDGKFDVFFNLEEIQLFLASVSTMTILVIILNVLGWTFALIYMKNIHSYLQQIEGLIKGTPAILPETVPRRDSTSTRCGRCGHHNISSICPCQYQIKNYRDRNASVVGRNETEMTSQRRNSHF